MLIYDDQEVIISREPPSYPDAITDIYVLGK